MRFWDSSAVVPLVLQQATSHQVEQWVAADSSIVIWTLTEIEVLSALQRLVREHTLAEQSARAAEQLCAKLVARMHVVAGVEEAKAIAARILRVHPLRAADSLQLAAALMWSDGRPSGLILHTFDRRLAGAAAREGFVVLPDPV